MSEYSNDIMTDERRAKMIERQYAESVEAKEAHLAEIMRLADAHAQEWADAQDTELFLPASEPNAGATRDALESAVRKALGL
jgi:hypothetical protein